MTSRRWFWLFNHNKNTYLLHVQILLTKASAQEWSITLSAHLIPGTLHPVDFDVSEQKIRLKSHTIQHQIFVRNERCKFSFSPGTSWFIRWVCILSSLLSSGVGSNVPLISTLFKYFPHKIVDSESKQTISQKL
jgi:hypothetical protein